MYRVKHLFPQSFKNLYHLAQAVLANFLYGFPSRKLKVIGVTGTDGKTTTVQMIARILEEAGKKVAMASTINFLVDGNEQKNLSHYTTESAFAVQKFIKKAVEAGSEYLVLETSSHALDQYRVWGINYQTAVITNISREHLDYHKTMEKYRTAKKKLFEIVQKNKGIMVVNEELENPEEFLSLEAKKKYAYSINNNKPSLVVNQKETERITAENIELGISETTYNVRKVKFEIRLAGIFNVENALAATCVGISEGIDLNTIKNALAKIKLIPGRMEKISNKRSLEIIVDFALTPKALDKLYGFVASIKKSEARIFAVFGSCGERDRGKRPIMGEIVSRYADVIILTNDEPYFEDPERIIEEIAGGIKGKKEGEGFLKIPDRRKAISKALNMAKEGDFVVITGMGNFESMIVRDKKIKWSDKEVVLELLESLD